MNFWATFYFLEKQCLFTDILSLIIALYGCWFIWTHKLSESVSKIAYLLPFWSIYYLFYILIFYLIFTSVLPGWMPSFIDHCYTFTEYLFVTNYLLSILKLKSLKKAIFFTRIAVVVIFTYISLSSFIEYGGISHRSRSLFYVIECLAILPFCIMYLKIFQKSNNHPYHEPNFWIIAGLSLFCICTLPLSTGEAFFYGKYPSSVTVILYAIYYIFYALLYFLIVFGATIDHARRRNTEIRNIAADVHWE